MGCRRPNTKEARVLRAMAAPRLRGGEAMASLQTALVLYLVANNPKWTVKAAGTYVRSFLRDFDPAIKASP